MAIPLVLLTFYRLLKRLWSKENPTPLLPSSNGSSSKTSELNWDELLKYVDYKSPELKLELLNPRFTSEKLRIVIASLSSMTQTMFGKKLVITRVWWHPGQEADPDSAHRVERWGICKGADIRAFDYFLSYELSQIEIFVNKGFPRSDDKKTIIIHGEGSNYHIHLQVEE